IFIGVLVGGIVFIGSSITRDLSGSQLLATWPYVLLGLALLVALGFEFVNGFHDTANAVATVIYTHSLDPQIAVVWSGFWNFAGVVTSTGAVAFGIVSLLLTSGIGSGIRNGLRPLDRCHHVEPRNLVVGPARLQLASLDRLDHRRGYRQPTHERALGHQRRGLGASQ